MLLAAVCVGIIEDGLIYASTFNALAIHCMDDEFRQMNLNGSVYELAELAEEWDTDFGSVAVAFMADRDNGTNLKNFMKDRYIDVRNHLVRNRYEQFYDAAGVYNNIIECLEIFPTSPESGMNFDDSFGSERNFGGQRQHEGTDIMPPVNERGVYPIRSVCDGTVENIGWLTLGGYRIGIRSDTGIYFYYAHLQSYAGDYAVGDRVRAGEVLGLMGDSGYGAEGTTGEFDVHLHFGIYISDKDGNEVSLNPYPYLLYLKERTDNGNSIMERDSYAV